MCQVRLQKTSLRKAGSCPWNGPVAWETFCKKALLVWKAEINLSGHTIHGVLASMCAKRPQPLELELPCPVLTVTDCRHCSDILHVEPTLLEHFIHGSRCIAHHLQWKLESNCKADHVFGGREATASSSKLKWYTCQLDGARALGKLVTAAIAVSCSSFSVK